ncbi:MAG TPA: cytochrome b/b6 domain-containing protein [Acidobacteriota bacterium]|nr:cytochrome b/b6 domain-containing protein [Acidobacteriota bacterium]
MDDQTSQKLSERRRLIEQLTENIIESAAPLTDPDTPEEALKKTAAEISERLEFETNVALNEVVTKYSPGRKRIPEEAAAERTFVRFGLNFRSQHVLLFTSVILLIITGIPLKFPEFGVSKFIIVDLFGGLENSSLVHRIGAVGLILVGIWHLLYSTLSRVGRGDFILMIPRPRDVIDFYHTVMYFIGRRSHGSRSGRFSFIEKFDYWAVYWGMVIMIGSGIILWFSEMFPKYGYDIAREAHSDEGLLATLAIVIWHFYNVHLNPEVFPMSKVWWHGRLTESQMKHHHPLEYAEILQAERQELAAQLQSGVDDKEVAS